VYNALHKNAGRVYLVGIEFSDFDENFDFRNGHTTACGSHGIEVARGLAIHEVATCIALPGFHERKIGVNAALQDVGEAVELALLLPFSYGSADARARIEAGDARATRAHAFSERTLGAEFHFEFSGEKLPLEFAILADIAGDHFADLVSFEEEPKPPAVHAGVIAGDCKALFSGIAQSEDESFRDAAQAEATDCDRHAVVNYALERGMRVGIDLRYGQQEALPSDPARTPQHPDSSMRG
jgi:hypothetical protein